MDRIPTIEDWTNSPIESLAAAKTLASQAIDDSSAAHSEAIALGIAAQVLAAAAPIAGQALAGPLGAAGGALAAAGVQSLASSLADQHADARKALTPDQQALVDQAIATGVQLAMQKMAVKT